MATAKKVLSTTDENIDSYLSVPLPFELAEGRYVVVRWKPTTSNRFSFNITAEENFPGQHVPFHFNPRIQENQLVTNAYHGGWGPDEKAGDMPFQVGVTTETKIVVRAEVFQCFVDGVEVCEFRQRETLTPEIAKFFFIYGDGEAEVLFGAESDCQFNYTLPYELAEGRYVIVRWKPANSNWFSFNFAKTLQFLQTDIPLVFNPRMNNQLIVKNDRVNGAWGVEENNGDTIFQVGVNTETKIVVRAAFYEFFINGVKLCDFSHRQALDVSKFFIIKGAGEGQVIFGDEATDEAQKPAADEEEKLTTPYEIPYQVSTGRKIYVSGIPNGDVNRFWVFLCADDDFDFVLIVKMKRKNVSINNRIEGNWKTKQRVQGFPFEVGQLFNIVIEVEDTKYKVSVNDQPLAEFKHRKLPITRINKLRVDERDGILELKRVQVE